ncbi:hypothetical protein DdX_11773 [Ditylenchus destructor]|uniref:Uncharacterized protein n=1 Tax=Ditylenchus destructor TaxID=166010 RepID=A0AAD4MVR0_9BILA|nr:hypothetical protein DdX_11773 [Ditylenchus destructor]
MRSCTAWSGLKDDALVGKLRYGYFAYTTESEKELTIFRGCWNPETREPALNGNRNVWTVDLKGSREKMAMFKMSKPDARDDMGCALLPITYDWFPGNIANFGDHTIDTEAKEFGKLVHPKKEYHFAIRSYEETCPVDESKDWITLEFLVLIPKAAVGMRMRVQLQYLLHDEQRLDDHISYEIADNTKIIHIYPVTIRSEDTIRMYQEQSICYLLGDTVRYNDRLLYFETGPIINPLRVMHLLLVFP